MNTKPKLIIDQIEPEEKEFTLYKGKSHWYHKKDDAIYDLCDLNYCSCGNTKDKYYIHCIECRNKIELEKYLKYPEQEYESGWLYSELQDEYFRDLEDVIDYLDNLEDSDLTINDLRLVFCKREKISKFNEDDIISKYEDILPEDSDYEVSNEILELFNKINDLLDSELPESYSPTKIRVKL